MKKKLQTINYTNGDKYYGEIQNMGGKRWDTSSLIKRFRK